MILTRRRVLCGLIAAPAIVAANNIMPVKALKLILPPAGRHWYLGKGVLSVSDDGINWRDIAEVSDFLIGPPNPPILRPATHKGYLGRS